MYYQNSNQPQQPQQSIRLPQIARAASNITGNNLAVNTGASPIFISRSPLQPIRSHSTQPPSSVENNPFSPQLNAMYHMPASNQQMLTPLSQQSIGHQQPMSNAPATPATPQQQLLMGHTSQQHMNQGPSSVQMGQGGPSSAQMGQGGPSSVQSYNIQSVQEPGSVGAQTNLQGSPLYSAQQISETDPIAMVKTLILKDFRKILQDLNSSAEKCADKFFVMMEEKKSGIAPHSNQNPLSVNPQSVNPLSVNAPNSVKSIDEKSETNENITPFEIYNGNFNNFLNVCDDIEKNLTVIIEVYRHYTKFDTTCSVRTPVDANTIPYAQLMQSYVDLMSEDKKLINQRIDEVNSIYEKIRQMNNLNQEIEEDTDFEKIGMDVEYDEILEEK